jgi:hypothetical protein
LFTILRFSRERGNQIPINHCFLKSSVQPRRNVRGQLESSVQRPCSCWRFRILIISQAAAHGPRLR